MILLLEILIGMGLFAAVVVPMTLKDPLGAINDYPPAIRKRCAELGLIGEQKRRFSKKDLLRKGLAMLIFVLLLALLLRFVNGADSFWKGFLEAYVIWLAIDWFDALVLDCLWFCHSKKVRIPGTEDMKEYRDYIFHLEQSCIGMLLGLPICLLAGLLVAVL